jgi:translocation and assembly module TamB
MRRVLPLVLTLLVVTPALAQEERGFFGRLFGTDEAASDEEQGGLLESFIEDNLSGEGRQVSIRGFAGALSGRATLDSLTVSDDQGEWLTLNDVVLDWNRGALFRGRLEVAELSAAEILLPRLATPAESDEAPVPEASGSFSLPELPVSVSIDKIAAGRVVIGQPVFGVEALVSVAGAVRLEGGEGSANLVLEKLDAPGGIMLDAAYSNANEVLALDLKVSEGPDGIVAALLDLPGRPSVDFSVSGEAPITAYAADISLATEGAERLTGRIATSQPAGSEDGTLRTVVTLFGDIAPIFNPEYQPFFGPDVRLGAAITSFPDGRLSIEDLDISAASLQLGGGLLIGSDKLPDEIRLSGEIASEQGAVLLPLPGVETRIDRMDLDVTFDAAEGDTWTGAFEIAGLDRPGFAAESLTLDGRGRIMSGDARAVTAALSFRASALDLGTPDAADAIGELVTGRADIDWASGAPLSLRTLTIEGESYALNGSMELALEEAGPAVSGQARVSADELSAFSGLAGRTLGGSISVETRFAAQPLAGLFDVSAKGESRNLIVSQPQADGILAGSASLDVEATRDETGISLRLTTLETPNASLTGQASLKSGGSSLSLAGTLADAALVLPQVSGPIRLNAAALEDMDRVWSWQLETALEGTRLTAEGNAVDIYGTPVIAAAGRFEADDLSDFAALAGRPLAGRIETDFSGEVVADLSRASVRLKGTASDLKVDDPRADALLAGPVALDLDGSMAGEVVSLRDSTIDGPRIRLRANGILVPEVGRFDLDGWIADASLVLEGAPAEPLEFAAEGQQDNRDWRFRTSAEGAGLSLEAEGLALDPLGPEPAVDGQLRARVENLAVLSDLAGRTLAGRLELQASGSVTADLTRFDVDATASGGGLRIGQAEADRLLAGDLAATLKARRDGGAIEIGTLNLSTGLLTASASGALASDGSEIDIEARLAEIGSFVSGFSGPLAVSGTIGQSADRNYIVDIAANGPGGAEANTSGSIAPDFSTVDLRVTGRAPLGFANTFIAPRVVSGDADFNLTLSGPPALSSVSGQISSSGARFIAPTLGLVMNEISLNTALSGGRAQISLAGQVENGGQVSVEGPLTLSAPFNADLGIVLRGVVLQDPRLYETSVDGRIAISGPLTGGARISGDLALGETNIRIPSSGLGGAGAVPEILHLNEPPPVRGTRSRAGLLESENGGDKAGGIAYPIDIIVNAPSRIFIRGRGLESEFGGSLRIAGDSANVVPIGAFNLIRGRLDILGQRLALEEATVTIQGSFLPVVRIRATTQTDEYTIAVIVAGPVSDPEISFTSEPDLPQEEVLARLIFGRGLDTLSPIQAARLALAVRTLAGRGGEGVVGNIRQGAGLADLDVTTDSDGNAAVRAGAYLGENLYTDVTVGSNGESELNLNLDVSKSFTLKGSVTNEGETSVGIFYERDY